MKKQVSWPRQKSLICPDVPNPFFHRLELSTVDKIQIAFMSLTIAPLRLILVGLLLLAVWPLAAVGVAFRSPEDATRPMTGWRRLLSPLIVLLCRGVFFVGGFYWITVRGKRATTKEAPILAVAPHSSFFDSLSLVHMGLTSVVAKSESAHIPVFGNLIRFSQPVLVQREDPHSRTNTIKEIQRRSRSGGAWPQIFIFPEGTCSNRSCLITFKGGAFFPGVPVQPVLLRYHNKLDTVTWTWDGPNAFQCLWYTLCQFQTNLEVEYLPVYVPSQEEIDNPKVYAHNVRAAMAKALNVPVTDHTYDDCRLMQRAKSLQLPMETGIVEFQKLHQKLGISYDDLRLLLIKFQKIAGQKGHVTLEEFANYLQVPISPALEQVFELYDRDGSGKIDFREYVIGLSLVSGPANTEDTLKLAFELFDPQKKGYISLEDLEAVLHHAFHMTTEDVEMLFDSVDLDKDGRITFEELQFYAEEKPEYAKLFTTYHELRLPEANGHATTAKNDKTGGKCKAD